MKKGEIDVKGFLNRVTFHENKICDGFLDFESVVDLPDDEKQEDIEDIDDEDAINQPVVSDIDEHGRLVCKACYSRPQDCCIVPCGHTYFCYECYTEKYDETKGCPVCKGSIVMAARIITS